MKKILVAYYSRTGTTKKVAELIAQKLGSELEEIKDTVDRSGIKGYLLSGRDATLKRLTELHPIAKNPAEYDLVVIGTPIWSWNVSAPVRTYATQQRNNFRSVAYFCTMGGSGDERAFGTLSEISGQKPLSTLSLKTREVMAGNMEKSVADFAEKLLLLIKEKNICQKNS
jgi:flavodoxin